MIGRFVITCLILCLIPGLAAAEFYKYRDQNGIVRFTDNLLDVPKDQRGAVEQYKEIVTPRTADETRPTDQLKDLNARADALNAERDLLAKEYADLEKEREAIEKATRNPQNATEYDTDKKQVDDYNAGIRAYEEKRKLFQEKVDAFNADAKNQ
jgi:hypothetical protein